MDLNFSKPLSQIEKIQCYLQDLNSNVATPRNSTFASSFKINRTLFDAEGAGAKELETWIDDMDSELPPLKNFILPVTLPSRKSLI
jgi:cob(I)alamin adenosyltransferase